MATIAVVDAGPPYAAADLDDADHTASVTALATPELRLVVPALVVAEASYFVGTRPGPRAESAFLHGLATLDVEGPTAADLERMARLVEEYADFPLGAADASAGALAERLGARVMITLDRRHFGAVRPVHADSFTLLP